MCEPHTLPQIDKKQIKAEAGDAAFVEKPGRWRKQSVSNLPNEYNRDSGAARADSFLPTIPCGFQNFFSASHCPIFPTKAAIFRQKKRSYLGRARASPRELPTPLPPRLSSQLLEEPRSQAHPLCVLRLSASSRSRRMLSPSRRIAVLRKLLRHQHAAVRPSFTPVNIPTLAPAPPISLLSFASISF